MVKYKLIKIFFFFFFEPLHWRINVYFYEKNITNIKILKSSKLLIIVKVFLVGKMYNRCSTRIFILPRICNSIIFLKIAYGFII